MGRGRQRAKQRKVARDLKYFSPETDYAALERELVSGSDHLGSDGEDDDVEDDKWSDYENYEASSDEDWDEDDWPTPNR